MGAEQSRAGAVVPGTANAVPHGMSTLGPNLQKRFAKGIQYNMKVVIKGDRNVGKSCLFHRLQGQAFKDEYIPTQEIQVACIQWNYKVTDDVVKVEIWDIVDKGKVKKRDGLKMDTEEADLAPTLDAEFIDVYKGTSGVIMILDITKYWTYEYVQRELKKVPLDIPVIIMASHRDMEEKRSVLTEEVQTFINELDRPSDAAAVYYMEASMKDGFGLKYLYRFFNVPFLELQGKTVRESLWNLNYATLIHVQLMETGATTGHGLDARNSAEEVARLEKEPATILPLLLEAKTVEEPRWNLNSATLIHAQLMETGVTTGLGQHVRNIAEEVARLEKEPATILPLLLEARTVKESRWNLNSATLIHAQLMEIGVTTVLGQHVRNSAVEVARLEEEPATILLQLLEGKTVKGSLWNLENAILTLVQLMEIGVTTGLGQHVRNIAEEVARLEEEPATILLQRLEEKTAQESLWSLEIATLTLAQRQTLLAQLRRNEEDLEAIKVELDLHSKSEEQDYERFKEYMERKRKGLPNTGVCTVPAGANEAADSVPSSEGTDVSELQDGTAMSLRSRLSQKVLQNTPLPAKLNPADGSGNQRIDNFVPEGKLDTNFLDNSNNPSPRPSPKPQRAKINDVQISDSDDEPCGNPQVTLDQESPDEEDMVVVHKLAPEPEVNLKINKTRQASLPDSSDDEESEDDGYKPIEIMADDDIPEEPTTKSRSAPVKEPSTPSVDTGPPPTQTIDPTTPPRNCKPISVEEEEEEEDGEEEPSSYVITPNTDYVDPNEEDTAEVDSPEKETNSITSLEDLTLSEKVSPQPTPPSATLNPGPELVVPEPVSTPDIDLDVLERISLAPPIAVQPAKKSPKTKKRSSPKREKSPRREESPKIEAVPKKKAPPKKSLLDIQLTSSDEDDPVATEVQTPEEPVNVLQTFDEPEIPKQSPPKRLNSSGSLKLTHVEPISIKPVEVPPVAAPAPKKEKKKKREKVPEKTAEEIREQRERDELDEFLGGGEVTVTPVTREKPRKKKTKKKKSRAAASAPGADDYEQF